MRFRVRLVRLVRRAAFPSAIALAVVASPLPALAHHGKGFLLVESDEMPHERQLFFFSSQDLIHFDGENQLELSPALLYGLTERFAIETHAHFAKAPGESLRYEAIAPALRVSLNSSMSDSPLRLGLAAEYEIARGEEADNMEGRVIAAYRTTDVNFTVNLIAGKVREEGADWEWGYAAGFRPYPERRLGVGIEALGTLSGPSSHELLGGVYFTGNRVTLKAGVGKGFGQAGPDWTIRTGLVVRLGSE
jgi:hypothetical protein